MDFVHEFCEILDLGLKFVPSIFNNLNNFFLFFLFELDKSFITLNNCIFFEKNKDGNTALKDSTFIETILKSIKSSKRKLLNVSKNIPLQHETLLIRNSLFSNLIEPNKFKLSSNLTFKQIKCVKKFFKEKPFVLCNSDKNVGWILLDKSLYNKLANDHLKSNHNIYKLMDYNPLDEVIIKINNTLLNLKNNDHISERLFKQLTPKESIIGKFRFLAKIHKKKFGIRPIINNINHP